MSKIAKLPHHIAEALRHETKGEIVRWHGQPNPARAFWMTTPAWLMGIPWTVFSGAMLIGLAASLLYGKSPKAAPGTIDAYLPAMGWIGVLFMVPFVLVGFGMLGSPFFVRRKARQTVYAITDQKFITIVAGSTTQVTTIDLARVQETVRKQHRDGSGSLKLVMGYDRDSDGDTVQKSHDMTAIEDVARVAALIEDLRHQRA